MHRGRRIRAALLATVSLSTVAAARAAAQATEADPSAPAHASEDELLAELDAADTVTSYPDPIEPVNRATLGFNEQLDGFVIEPISRGYSAVMPDPAELAVRRVFRNLAEPISFLNHTLRLEPRLGA